MDTSFETQSDLELKLYVLRSDFNRAVDYADQLRKELIELRETVAQRSADGGSADLFTQDMALLVERVAELASENEEANRLIEGLRAEVARYASTVDGKGDALLSEIEALTSKLKAMTDQSSRLEAERDQVAVEKTAAMNLAAQLGVDRDRLAAVLLSEEAQARRLSADKEALTAELEDTQRALVATRSNLSKVRTECEDLEVSLAKATRGQRRNEERAIDLAEQLGAVAEKAAELESLRRAHSTTESELKTSFEALQGMEQANKALKGGIAKYEELLAELEPLRRAYSVAQSELKTTSEALQDMEQANKALKGGVAKYEELLEELELLRQAHSAAQSELKTTSGALQGVEQANEALKGVIAKYEESLAFLEQRSKELGEALVQSKELIESLQHEGRLAEQVKQLLSSVELMKPTQDLANLPAREGELIQPVAVDQQLQEFSHQFHLELDQRRDQIISTMEHAVREMAGKFEKRLEELNRDQLAEAQYSNRDLRAGLLSRFQLIASEVSIMRRMRLEQASTADGESPSRQLYLDLLERTLTGFIYEDAPLNPTLQHFDPEQRLRGWDWPSEAHTMIGRARLRSLRELVEDVLRRNVKGDFLEAGVWRGGACILMRGILSAYGVRDRKVWVADSFAGLPEPDAELYPADAGDKHHVHSELAVSVDEVRKNFAKYNLLDERVVFLPGWFKDTLRVAPIESLAVLRLDGDMYSSTIETLQALYARVTHGGYVIVDDYFLPGCRAAVMDFRKANGIDAPIEEIDGVAVFWKVNRRKNKSRNRSAQ